MEKKAIATAPVAAKGVSSYTKPVLLLFLLSLHLPPTLLERYDGVLKPPPPDDDWSRALFQPEDIVSDVIRRHHQALVELGCRRRDSSLGFAAENLAEADFENRQRWRIAVAEFSGLVLSFESRRRACLERVWEPWEGETDTEAAFQRVGQIFAGWGEPNAAAAWGIILMKLQAPDAPVVGEGGCRCDGSFIQDIPVAFGLPGPGLWVQEAMGEYRGGGCIPDNQVPTCAAGCFRDDRRATDPPRKLRKNAQRSAGDVVVVAAGETADVVRWAATRSLPLDDLQSCGLEKGDIVVLERQGGGWAIRGRYGGSACVLTWAEAHAPQPGLDRLGVGLAQGF